MSEDKKQPKSREQELDDFWDISALIPPKKTPPPRHRAPVTLTEITTDTAREQAASAVAEALESVSEALTTPHPHIAHEALTTARDALSDAQTRLTRTAPAKSVAEQGSEPPRKQEESSTVIKRYIPPHTPEAAQQKPAPEDEYTPDAAMLHRVRIYRWKTTYQYYEDFCRQATALYDRHGELCTPVSFFSYVPQYSQMNRAQLSWYLYWRDQIRRGEILQADYSYILLYIYEIINLADTVDPRVGQQQLCLLREAFHDSYPRLGHLLGEWICDYSLIHHLPPLALNDLSTVADCTLKEFYVPETTAASDRYAAALIAFGSNYAYTKSKFATGDNRALYDTHMLGALRACIADSGEVGQRMAGAGLEESRLIRDAYTGALCSHRVKRRIEIDYCSFARSHELRILVTDIMKYTENKLRSYLGVKSRLGLYALPQVFRDCIDRYMRAALPAKERVAKPAPRQEYEALYDVPKTAFSPAHAAEIEATSWTTTERLISAFEDREPLPEMPPIPIAEPPADIPSAPAPEVSPSPKENSTSVPDIPETPPTLPNEDDDIHLLQSKLGDLFVFINLSLNQDPAAQRAFARNRGEMLDSIADRINETAADILGDVLLEECDGAYTVIEDYRPLFESES